MKQPHRKEYNCDHMCSNAVFWCVKKVNVLTLFFCLMLIFVLYLCLWFCLNVEYRFACCYPYTLCLDSLFGLFVPHWCLYLEQSVSVDLILIMLYDPHACVVVLRSNHLGLTFLLFSLFYFSHIPYFSTVSLKVSKQLR